MNTKRRTQMMHRSPVYLSLDTVSLDPDVGRVELGRLVSKSLQHALALPSIRELSSVEGRRLMLNVHVLDVGGGCHVIRSSYLLALLGFGSAFIRLRSQVHDLDTGEVLLNCTLSMRHNGLNRSSADYLCNNGASLVEELSSLAAFDLTMRVHRRVRRFSGWRRLVQRFTHQHENKQYANSKSNDSR